MPGDKWICATCGVIGSLHDMIEHLKSESCKDCTVFQFDFVNKTVSHHNGHN